MCSSAKTVTAQEAQEFMLQVFLYINQCLYENGCITENIYAAAKEYIISANGY